MSSMLEQAKKRSSIQYSWSGGGKIFNLRGGVNTTLNNGFFFSSITTYKNPPQLKTWFTPLPLSLLILYEGKVWVWASNREFYNMDFKTKNNRRSVINKFARRSPFVDLVDRKWGKNGLNEWKWMENIFSEWLGTTFF